MAAALPRLWTVRVNVQPDGGDWRRPMTETDLSTWLVTMEAAMRIGCSTRVIERLAADGKLEKRLRPQKGSPDVAVFSPESVAEEATRRHPAPAPFVVDAGRAVAHGNGHDRGQSLKESPGSLKESPGSFLQTSPAGDDPIRQLFAAALRAVLSPPSPPVSVTVSEKAFLTIKEAAAWTGLSQAYLRRSIDNKTLKAIRDRGWRVRRKDLEAL